MTQNLNIPTDGETTFFKPRKQTLTVETRSKLGELAQGVLSNGVPFLVSGNVRFGPFYARATFTQGSATLHIVPPEKIKARKAAQILGTYLNAKGISLPNGVINITSNIPIGGGLGSSSADISITLRLLLKVTGYHLTYRDLYHMYVQIERSDPVDLEAGRLILAQQTLGKYWNIGLMPPMVAIAAQVVEKPVDTATVAHLDSTRRRYTKYYQRMIEDVNSEDPRRIGQAATQSSTINQELPNLSKPYFDDFKKLSEATGGLGIVCSHTGQYLGILFDEHQVDLGARTTDCQQGLTGLGLTPLIFKY